MRPRLSPGALECQLHTPLTTPQWGATWAPEGGVGSEEVEEDRKLKSSRQLYTYCANTEIREGTENPSKYSLTPGWRKPTIEETIASFKRLLRYYGKRKSSILTRLSKTFLQ